MNTINLYLIASSWIFLVGWAVLLLVACALAFQGDSAEPCVARVPSTRDGQVQVPPAGRQSQS